MNEPASAVIVELDVPVEIEALRRVHDPAAADGVPAHVTVLYPFLPAGRLDDRVRASLDGIAAQVEPFEVTFTTVATWPSTVYLVPEPDEPFRRLTELVVQAYPGHPPYGGVHAEIVPHLTVADRSEPPLGPIASAAARALPFRARASAIDLLATASGPPHWRRRWRFPLGGGVTR
jgi:2'-5' RNA ligase